MSALDNEEVTKALDPKTEDMMLSDAFKSHSTTERNQESYRIRMPKKVLHFSDGTIVVDDSDEPDDDEGVEATARSTSAPETQSAPPVNPKTLSWLAWFQHYTTTTGQRTLNTLDNIGENIAYYLGITTPKYQYEIDEFNRAREAAATKKREKEIELKSWATTSTKSNPSDTVVRQVGEVPPNRDTP